MMAAISLPLPMMLKATYHWKICWRPSNWSKTSPFSWQEEIAHREEGHRSGSWAPLPIRQLVPCEAGWSQHAIQRHDDRRPRPANLPIVVDADGLIRPTFDSKRD